MGFNSAFKGLSDQHSAETATYTTNTRDIYTRSQLDSNLQSKQTSGCFHQDRRCALCELKF
jgi:hypothetical protein